MEKSENNIGDVDNDDELPISMDVKYPMLAFEKQIFMDIFEKDALVVMAK